MDASWFVIWAIGAALVFVLGVAVGRRWGPDTSGLALMGLAAAAWLGEFVVAVVLAPFLAGELSLMTGPLVWVIATGGPIQPLAVIAGALTGEASVRSRSVAPIP